MFAGSELGNGGAVTAVPSIGVVAAISGIAGTAGTAGTVVAAGLVEVGGASAVATAETAAFAVAPSALVTVEADATGGDGQAGGAPSVVVGATLDAASGGTPSTGSFQVSLVLGAACGVPSLIFTYRTTPTTTKTVIVISGRMELIDRPP
jgi:hypothetical protein